MKDKATKNWGPAGDAAAILGISTGTLDRWIREERVLIRRLGQRISLEDVRRLAEVGEEQYNHENADIRALRQVLADKSGPSE